MGKRWVIISILTLLYIASPPGSCPANGIASSSWINVRDYGAAGDDFIDDATAIQDAIDAVSASGGGTVYLPAGIYKITDTIIVPAGVKLIGAGAADGPTVIKQYTNSIPIIKVAGLSNAYKWAIEDIQLSFHTQQTSAGGIGIQLGDAGIMAYEGRIRNIYIDKAYDGIKTANLPGAYAWMNILEQVKVYKAYNWSFYFSTTEGANSANTFINCYAIQESGNAYPNARAFYINNQSEFIMINCAADHFDYYDVVHIQSSSGTILGLHLENCNINKDGSGYLIDIASSNVSILNSRISDCEINVVSEAWLLYVNGAARCMINGLREYNTSVTAGDYYTINASPDAEVYVTGWQIEGTTPNIRVADTFPYRIKVLNNDYRNIKQGTKIRTYGSTAPSSGNWSVGDIIWNVSPAAGEPMGWVCIDPAGSGTWQVFGQAGYRSGPGNPSGYIKPHYIGEEYLDTTAKCWYKSTGMKNTDWTAISIAQSIQQDTQLQQSEQTKPTQQNQQTNSDKQNKPSRRKHFYRWFRQRD